MTTTLHPSDRLWAGHGKQRPAAWPLDLLPGDCRACYDEHGHTGRPRGVSVPEEQCTRHRGGRL